MPRRMVCGRRWIGVVDVDLFMSRFNSSVSSVSVSAGPGIESTRETAGTVGKGWWRLTACGRASRKRLDGHSKSWARVQTKCAGSFDEEKVR